MTSSTMAGERRWGSARRGGMTVLGKVAVPKPLNLPSQRLENHGLDPNVEIVPKGTLNWGNRSSSSATNAWGSSSLSPSADSSANSPSHLSGRPSSGGSGTRPSTAGSDRPPIEPTGNAWRPNSRPSSASGALASNESSLTSLRPRSAETRPASSQLSRFAEPASDSPGAWGASGTTERLGVVSSKKDGFSLSSGDFPTLGSDKDHPGKSTESKDPGSHARPSSASGRVTQTKDKTVTSHADDASGAVNTWRKDGSQNVGDEVQPSMEKWQGEPQQYFNPNVPPQHFDAWRGPMNAPAGVWYRGPPGGPPYGAPIGPGGFPIEPFPYFRPQIPPPAFANSQPVPPPRGGPRGHHPKNGNAYRPQIPDAYVRPGMPFRPGFFPAPMTFEGYYGPPMGYCNSNERDIPFMGIGAGPSVYDRCKAPNTPDPGDSRARASGTGPSGKTMSDDVESVHSSDARGPYKVLIKQHSEWGGKEQGENREHKPLANASHPVKGEKAGVIPRKYEWGAEDDGEEDLYSSDNFDNRGGYVSDTVQAKSSQSSGSMRPADDCWIKNSESVTSSSSQTPQVSTANGRDSALPSTIKGATLIQKIEGLNAKVRAGDGRVDYPSSGKDQMSGPNNVNAKVDTSTNKAGKSAVLLEGTSASGYVAPTSHGVVVSAGDRMSQPPAAMSRRPYHGMSSGIDHRGKGKFRNQDADGWQRKPVAAEFPSMVPASKVESACDFRERDAHQAVAGINPPAKDEGESVAELHDSTDSQAQRAKMRELAKQRAIQLQKEEEERIREQKAKALAKLEELNRRMQSGDASNQTTKKPLPSGTSQKEQEGRDVEPRESATKLEAFTLVTPLKAEVVAPIDENSGNQVAGSAIPSKALPVETSKTMKLESVPRDDSVPLKEDVVNASAAGGKTAPQLSEGGGLKLKRTSYKQKQNTTFPKNLNEKSIPVNASDAQISPVVISANDAASNVVASSEVSSSNQPYVPNNSSIVLESSAPQRRRSNKSIKNKNKQDDAPSLSALTATEPSETIPPKTSNENVKSQASTLDLNTGSIQAAVDGESGVELSEQRPSLRSEEAHGRVNQLKSQHSRRMPRNQQANRFVDKIHGNDAVMWAPVRSQNKAENKAEATVEGVQKPIAESVTPAVCEESLTPAKCDNVVQNSSKSKRAEMERYVPKPVAKELAQQVGMQKPDSSSVNISTPDETASQQPVSSATGNIGSSLQSREGVAKHNKQGKVHGAWRQRGSTEFSDANNVQQGSSSTSDPSKNFQEVILKHQPLNLEANSAQAETKTSSELNSNYWIASSNSDASAPDTSPVSKDLGVTGKGNRHPYRGHRNMGNSRINDNKDVSSAETDRTHIQTPASDINQSDRDIASKETRGTGERISSHWQPKSHANSVSSQRGSRITGSQNVVPEARTVTKKDYPRRQQVKTPPEHYEENNESGTQLDQCLSENKVVVEVPKAGNHEPRRERKLTSSKGRPYSPNHNPVAADESGPAVSTDTQRERPFSAGSRRHGNQISRSVRGHQSPRDWSVQDSWQQNIPTNRDRQRHNMHYEYQPVGSYNNTKSNNFEGLADGSRNAGPRYRERGQSYPKRGGGNFHGRQSGRLPVDAGCD